MNAQHEKQVKKFLWLIKYRFLKVFKSTSAQFEKNKTQVPLLACEDKRLISKINLKTSRMAWQHSW